MNIWKFYVNWYKLPRLQGTAGTIKTRHCLSAKKKISWMNVYLDWIFSQLRKCLSHCKVLSALDKVHKRSSLTRMFSSFNWLSINRYKLKITCSCHKSHIGLMFILLLDLLITDFIRQWQRNTGWKKKQILKHWKSISL